MEFSVAPKGIYLIGRPRLYRVCFCLTVKQQLAPRLSWRSQFFSD